MGNTSSKTTYELCHYIFINDLSPTAFEKRSGQLAEELGMDVGKVRKIRLLLQEGNFSYRMKCVDFLDSKDRDASLKILLETVTDRNDPVGRHLREMMDHSGGPEEFASKHRRNRSNRRPWWPFVAFGAFVVALVCMQLREQFHATPIVNVGIPFHSLPRDNPSLPSEEAHDACEPITNDHTPKRATVIEPKELIDNGLTHKPNTIADPESDKVGKTQYFPDVNLLGRPSPQDQALRFDRNPTADDTGRSTETESSPSDPTTQSDHLSSFPSVEPRVMASIVPSGWRPAVAAILCIPESSACATDEVELNLSVSTSTNGSMVTWNIMEEVGRNRRTFMSRKRFSYSDHRTYEEKICLKLETVYLLIIYDPSRQGAWSLNHANMQQSSDEGYDRDTIRLDSLPSNLPTCPEESMEPKGGPTNAPTRAPTLLPTGTPTTFPTSAPTSTLTHPHSAYPTLEASSDPSETTFPSGNPTSGATSAPTFSLSAAPTLVSSMFPSAPVPKACNRRCALEIILAPFDIDFSNLNGAFTWLADTDTWGKPETSPETESKDAWFSRYFAAKLFQTTGGESWTRKYRWLTSDSVCQWNIQSLCGSWDQAHVITQLHISGNSLSGDIPQEIGQLSHLTSLQIEDVRNMGGVPSTLSAVSKLEQLHLSNITFTESADPPQIPLEWSRLSNLNRFDLRFMTSLQGDLPDGFLGNFPKLTRLGIHDTGLTGSFPTEMGLLTNLRTAVLSRTYFTGTIPSEMRQLSKLETLYLSTIRMDSTLHDDVITHLTSLRGLHVVGKFNSTEKWPSSIQQLTNLEHLHWVEGFEPEPFPHISSLTNLGHLNLGGWIEGGIPSWLHDMTKLTSLTLPETLGQTLPETQTRLGQWLQRFSVL